MTQEERKELEKLATEIRIATIECIKNNCIMFMAMKFPVLWICGEGIIRGGN